jgi:hypothetical protein
VEIEELFGLPAHPLVVHAAVVLLPLAAITTLDTAAVVAVSLVAGAGATWTVVDVGHSGAMATWDDVGAENGD